MHNKDKWKSKDSYTEGGSTRNRGNSRVDKREKNKEKFEVTQQTRGETVVHE